MDAERKDFRRAALAGGDRELAGRIAHTVKGVAGNLGIGSVQSAAEKIERAIRDQDAATPVVLEQFESALSPMVQATERALAATAPAPVASPKGAFDPVAAAAAMAKLRALIEANDGDAAEALPSVEDALAGTVDKARLDALRDALGDFDFEGALSKLEEIAKQCGVS